MSDVTNPSHYGAGRTGIEAKDALQAMYENANGNMGRVAADGPGRFRAICPMAFFWWGLALKYLWRWPRKNGEEDLIKCEDCVRRLRVEMYGEGEE